MFNPVGPQLATAELLAAITLDSRVRRRTIVFASPGSSELELLDFARADASAGGEGWTNIILRHNPPLRITILEEFLHGTQGSLGKLDVISSEAMLEAEIEVKEFMIRHSMMLGLNDRDVAVLRRLLEDL
jgi:hypothetical protein